MLFCSVWFLTLFLALRIFLWLLFFALCVLVMDNSMHTAVIGTPVDMCYLL